MHNVTRESPACHSNCTIKPGIGWFCGSALSHNSSRNADAVPRFRNIYYKLMPETPESISKHAISAAAQAQVDPLVRQEIRLPPTILGRYRVEGAAPPHDDTRAALRSPRLSSIVCSPAHPTRFRPSPAPKTLER